MQCINLDSFPISSSLFLSSLKMPLLREKGRGSLPPRHMPRLQNTEAPLTVSWEGPLWEASGKAWPRWGFRLALLIFLGTYIQHLILQSYCKCHHFVQPTSLSPSLFSIWYLCSFCCYRGPFCEHLDKYFIAQDYFSGGWGVSLGMVL